LYADFESELAPTWLQFPIGSAYLEAHGQAKDAQVDWVIDSILIRFAPYADSSALALIGVERNLKRYPGESLEAFRDRALNAFDFWSLAGTKTGLELALEQLGYTPTVIEFGATNPLEWDRFSVILRPGTKFYGTEKWGQPIGKKWNSSGTKWGLGIREDETQRILGVIRSVKAAHSRFTQLSYVDRGQIWGEVGTWGQPVGKKWASARSVTLWEE
jgi:hypothetical protein